VFNQDISILKTGDLGSTINIVSSDCDRNRFLFLSIISGRFVLADFTGRRAFLILINPSLQLKGGLNHPEVVFVFNVPTDGQPVALDIKNYNENAPNLSLD
jgi:hypothetical protein